jgi:type IV pilus assembly protein PilC
MPTFSYTARDRTGNSLSGTLVADNKQALVGVLQGRGLIPTSVQEAGGGGRAAAGARAPAAAARAFRGRKVKSSEMVVFTRQLATIVNAGLPLMQGLDILSEQTENVNFTRVLSTIAEDVEAGESFSDALRKHGRVFTELYVAMVRAGEASGNLDGILLQLADYMEAAEALKQKIKAAMTYPTVVFAFVILLSTALLTWVVPKFEEIFMSLDAKLPAPTLALMALSNVLRHYILFVIAGMVALIVALRFYTRTPAGRYQFDRLKLQIPVFGKLFRKVAISRFTRTFSTLTRSGVPILSSLEIVANTAGNAVFAGVVRDSMESVRAGQTIADPLAKSGEFPPMVTRMISVGEKTGALEQLLLKISDFYDQEVDSTVASLTSLIEPMLIVLLGVIVGGMVIALILPIFGLGAAVTGAG